MISAVIQVFHEHSANNLRWITEDAEALKVCLFVGFLSLLDHDFG